MAHYEIEIKSLLGEKINADLLKQKMNDADESTKLTSKNKQLNHYFEGGDIAKLFEVSKDLLSEDARGKFLTMIAKGKNFSVRTRQKDEAVFLVLKASIDEGSSSNTVSRLEFEEPVLIPLDALDTKVMEAGFSSQAKWSREREEYAYKGANVCIDRNAGYGYLAEFEKVVHDETVLPQVRAEIDALMLELGVTELAQDRLERMFEFYNMNWPDYYGTEKTFVIN